jgi:HlyD family secretion protein
MLPMTIASGNFLRVETVSPPVPPVDEVKHRGEMKTWKKVALGVGAGLLLAAIVAFTVYQSRKNVVTVQTGKAQVQDLAAVIAKSDYDAKKATWEGAEASVAQAQAQIAQSRAQLESAQGRITQNQANLRRVTDVLDKTYYFAPYDGLVTNLPVREGETVVIGIQNSPGSTLMTIADMSIITAEVKADETDIVNVQLGQPAEVTIDAIPNKSFKGTVTEIGNNAVVRSTGVSTSQQTIASQEAKDFKVVVTLQDPPDNLRPGLSTTAKVTTATRQNALAIPIQALTVRKVSELRENPGKGSVQAASLPLTNNGDDKKEIQGVFVIRNRRAAFVPVETGINGTTDIEVLKGLQKGDEIITGSYKVLRTLRNGASVRIDNSAPKKLDEESS